MVRPDAQAPARAGLSGEAAAQRLLAGFGNEVSDQSSRSLWQIFRANVLTVFNGIVAGSFALLLVIGQWQDALFGFAAIGNAVIGVVQEYQAKRSLDRLAVLDRPTARVLRDGFAHEIARATIVRDDILVLRAGDQLSADAVVLDSEGLQLDESLLTGESDPVDKPPGSEALSGSSVLAGQGRARVIRVGDDASLSRLTAEAKRFSLVNSEIRSSLNKILQWITWMLLPVMLLVINGQMQANGGWSQAITTGAWRTGAIGAVASIVAMIPLGLVLLTSVAFAVGGVRLAREKVLIQELASVEGLARVDVLCLDKTGTLTEGRIVFEAVHEVSSDHVRGWEQALGWFGADPNANATARCLSEQYASGQSLSPISTVAFSSARKWSAVSFDVEHGGEETWVLGAPELVLTSDTPRTNSTLEKAAALASTGSRTLILAHASGALRSDPPHDAQLPLTPVPVVLLTFREKTRSDAGRTLAYFLEQGVSLRIISGDDPHTVAAVARDVGLDIDKGFDARSLPDDQELLAEVMEEHTVFGRVTPTQKKEMIRALQSRGHTVAMTGDGVNDVLALKEADIGIAMGSAAAATKAVSRLVLLDGQFARLPGVVAEGRRVIANIERVSMLFLTKTTYAIVISVVFGSLLWAFPFLPRQLSVTDGLTIGIPAFFLALMPNTRRYTPGFLRRSLTFAIPAGMTVAATVIALNIYATVSGAFDPQAVRTASVIVLTLVGLWILVVTSRPLNAQRVAVVLAMCAGLAAVLIVPVVRDFLDLSWPPTRPAHDEPGHRDGRRRSD
ncbi:HAD-IC family P-type ATPase [Arthrobacter agilis]|uniref:HAD-IC family P-type ATPase n=1 Tax=Arthrobacter agilis TaxID=37921 RepID=UPI002780823E|nr:HAD-IC family P-type ATPase [Arthrobacter agilis]MDQ0735085.1 cation-transporting ATPase E [Arthrobacter agilis]